MSLLETPFDELDQIYDSYDNVMSIVPKPCRTCPHAMKLAVELSIDVERGSKTPDQAEMDYAMRLGGRCMEGVIELTNDNYCLGMHQRFERLG